jgi:hypothetical protein
MEPYGRTLRWVAAALALVAAAWASALAEMARPAPRDRTRPPLAVAPAAPVAPVNAPPAAVVHGDDSWSAFVDRWQTLATRNLRLTELSVVRRDGVTRFRGLWQPGADAHALYRYDSWSAFVNKWFELAAQGLRLVDIEVSREGQVTWFTGVWRAGVGAHALYRYDSWPAFAEKWNELATAGLQLVDLERSREDGRTWFTGVWRSARPARPTGPGRLALAPAPAVPAVPGPVPVR